MNDLLLSKLPLATRFAFFTGKGGVGKTSVASAIAVALADSGKKVLLVSTDPASNLDEVFGVSVGPTPSAIPEVPGLMAMNLDPEQAARSLRERVIGPYRGILPQASLASMEEQLSGACTVEIAAFDEFSKLVAEPASFGDFDHLLFDTAPTGHTLRLLTLPSAWDGYLETHTGGVSCLGPLAGLQKQKALYEQTAATLADPAATTLVLVTRPEPAANREADKTRADLFHLEIRNLHLVVNGTFEASGGDPLATAIAAGARGALDRMPAELAALPRTTFPLQAHNLVGPVALRTFGLGPGPDLSIVETRSSALASYQPLEGLVDDLVRSGMGVVMTMGKGGVGKTTLAAAVALELARRGQRVHLRTTDPAAHVTWTLGEEVPGLHVSRIDPEAETRAYADRVLAEQGPHLDAKGRALLEEDLRSPCTEEVAVFLAFARLVAQGDDGFVVLDTAPTGHTLLLLDASQSYHREVARTGRAPDEVDRLLVRLRDPAFTRVLIVTLPEPTPVHEAERLQADLERAGIEPHAWIVNRSLAASGTTDALLAARGLAERPWIQRVAQKAPRHVLLPWLEVEPAGIQALGLLAGASRSSALVSPNR